MFFTSQNGRVCIMFRQIMTHPCQVVQFLLFKVAFCACLYVWLFNPFVFLMFVSCLVQVILHIWSVCFVRYPWSWDDSLATWCVYFGPNSNENHKKFCWWTWIWDCWDWCGPKFNQKTSSHLPRHLHMPPPRRLPRLGRRSERPVPEGRREVSCWTIRQYEGFH